MNIVLIILIGYIFGSIPSALIAGKAFKEIDIRQHGSGNLGATNAFRVLGTKAGTIVILADALKGALPALIGLSMGGYTLALIGGIAAVIGHSFPIFANFKGGKGIATGAGAYLVIMPFGLMIAVLVFLLVLLATNYVSLSSIIGAGILAIMSLIFYKSLFVTLATLAICGFVIYRHRDNIVRLWNGTEHKSKLWR